MKLKGNKKQSNGKSVVIFDTEGQHIGEVVDLMASNGWNFNILQVTYEAKDGTKKLKNVPAERADEIYRKYRFARWSFEAVHGNASVTGSMDCDKHAIAITGSKGGGYKLLSKLPSPETRHDRTAPGKGVSYADFSNGTTAYKDPRSAASSAIERQSARAAGRMQDERDIAEAQGKSKTGIPYIIASIVEILFVAPLVFAIFALSDTLKGRKALSSNPIEAEGYFKEARNLLIGGAVSAIIFGIIIFWKFHGVIFT